MKRAARALACVAVTLIGGAARAHGEPCTSVAGNDTCPQGEQCSAQDGTEGKCNPPPCSADAECGWPFAHCDTRRTPPVCVECYATSECSPPRTCELDPRSYQSNRCVECLLGDPNACSGSDAGARCLLPRQVCGCASAADCGARQSCDASGRCVDVPDAGVSAPEADAGRPTSEDAGPTTIVHRSGGCGVASACSPDDASAFAALLTLAMRVQRRRRRRAAMRTSSPANANANASAAVE